MDYFDMVESLRKKQHHERMQPGYYDGCTKIDWEFDKLCVEMDKNAVVVKAAPGDLVIAAQSLRTHHHPDFDGLSDLMKSQMVHRPTRAQQSGNPPVISELVDICKSMSQGSGRIVSLMS